MQTCPLSAELCPQPINAINLTGHATLELTAAKPEDGAIMAIAGERGAVWPGLVECTTHAHIFLKRLDGGKYGNAVVSLRGKKYIVEEWQSYLCAIHRSVTNTSSTHRCQCTIMCQSKQLHTSSTHRCPCTIMCQSKQLPVHFKTKNCTKKIDIGLNT